MNGETVQLSKWWRTPSAQAAFARAAEAKRQRIAKLKRDLAERKARLKRDVEEWVEQ
jgi:hypothetical protein